MTSDNLIVIAPWLVFGAGLAVIAYQLLAHRRSSRQPFDGRALPPLHHPSARGSPDDRHQPPGSEASARETTR